MTRILLENNPDIWRTGFPVPGIHDHKYSRGAALIAGGAMMTGASRLAARAAQRSGAGLVVLAVPSPSFPIYAGALESILVRPVDTVDEWAAVLEDKKFSASLVGPGFGVGEKAKQFALRLLETRKPCVLDADALSSFQDNPTRLFEALHQACVLTPHQGEFERLFGGGLALKQDKVEAAAVAAQRAGCVVVLKGPQTVIASPIGEIIVNHEASPWLATGGTGDVLAGLILGLIAQKMPIFHASAAAVWLHGHLARQIGEGLIPEDIIDRIGSGIREIIK